MKQNLTNKHTKRNISWAPLRLCPAARAGVALLEPGGGESDADDATSVEAKGFLVLMLLAAVGVAEALRADDAISFLIGGNVSDEIFLEDLEELLMNLLAGFDDGKPGNGEGGGRGGHFDEC